MRDRFIGRAGGLSAPQRRTLFDDPPPEDISGKKKPSAQGRLERAAKQVGLGIIPIFEPAATAGVGFAGQ